MNTLLLYSPYVFCFAEGENTFSTHGTLKRLLYCGIDSIIYLMKNEFYYCYRVVDDRVVVVRV